MPKTAFLVLRSPQEIDPTHTLKRFAERSEATTILFEDGVFHAILEEKAQSLGHASHEVLVSAKDLEARGFLSSDLKVGKAVGYDDIVDCIMERTERTITV